MQSHPTRPDISARILAFTVFAIGIGLLCLVFALAWQLFRAPVPHLELPVATNAPPQPAANIGIALTAFVRQLLLLTLMTIAGSVIASKGIHLYFTAASHARPSADANSTTSGT